MGAIGGELARTWKWDEDGGAVQIDSARSWVRRPQMPGETGESARPVLSPNSLRAASHGGAANYATIFLQIKLKIPASPRGDIDAVNSEK